MRHKTHPVNLALVAALTLLVSCSKPSAAPEPQEAPPASAPAPVAPTASAPAPVSPAPVSPAIDQSIATNVGDPAKFRDTMTTLQRAVEKHDAEVVAALVSYPIDIDPRTKKVLHIRTPAAFVAQYDSIITPHIAEIVTRQKYNDLFVNDQGAMFGNGEVWISGICRDKSCAQTDIRIKTIQNPDGPSNK
jgi:hypothetical protein